MKVKDPRGTSGHARHERDVLIKFSRKSLSWVSQEVRLCSLFIRAGAMGTARNVELYSLAYRLALKQISKLQKREQPNIALRLHASIRRQLKKGATDPFFIAVEALKNVRLSNVSAGQSAGADETLARKRHRRRQRQKLLRIYRETAASLQKCCCPATWRLGSRTSSLDSATRSSLRRKSARMQGAAKL
jgi:hypothetical protein